MIIIKKIYSRFTATRLRKILSSILIVLIVLTSIRYIFIPAPPAKASDMLLKFDEGYGTTINDGNNNISGTITNAVWKPDEFCKFGKCLYFDGTGDLVNFGDDSDLDFAAAANFTINGWFRTPDISAGTRVLVAKHNSTAGGYKIYVDSSGNLVFAIDDDSAFTPDDSVSTQSKTKVVDDNNWHFFSAVKTGTTSITLYVDGALMATDSSISATGTLENSDTFYVGIDGDGTSNGFSGFIDEIKVYQTTARSAAEVKADFLGTTLSRGVAAAFGPNLEYLNNGLSGYWRLEETASPAIDMSGNGRNGTWTGSPAAAIGKFGNSIELNGTTQYLTYGDSSEHDLTPPFGMFAWINMSVLPSTKGSESAIISKYGTVGGGTAQYLLSISTSDVMFFFKHNGTSGSFPFNNGYQFTSAHLNTWVHVGVTADRDGNYRMYVNGEVVDSSVLSDIDIRIDTNTAFRVGAIDNASLRPFGGKIDEVRTYKNRTWSPAEVLNLYNAAPGPVGHWKLDENTSTTANDVSGNDNSATLTNSPNWVSGKFGSGVVFTGSDQHITRADDSDFDFADDADLTFETWFKHGTASSQEVILSKFNEAGYKIIMENDGDITCALDYDSTWTPTDFATSTAATYDDNNWHHIACVKSGASKLSLYIDGSLITEDTTLTATNTLTNSDPIYFGIDADGSTNDFTGSLDNIMIYNYARTNSQVVQDMNGGHPVPGSPVGSATAKWKFDEGYSVTAYDSNQSTGGSEDLTLSTASWTNSGKFGKAWNGTGAVWVSRANDSDLDFSASESFTLTGWFKSDSATNPANGTEYILSTSSGNTDVGYQVYAKTDGTICFAIDDDGTWTDVESCTTSDFYDASWHNFVAIRNTTSDTTEIYIDGIERDSDTDPTTATLDGDNVFYIGDFDGDNNATSGTEEFAGDIDEVQVFRSALNADSVKQIYSQGSMAVMGASSTDSSGNASWSDTDAYCPPGQGSSCSGPNIHFKLDENTGTTVYDTSTNNLSNSSFTGVTWLSGKKGSGIKLDGDNSGIYITDPGSSSVLDITDSFTLSAWINPSAMPGGGSYDTILFKGTSGTAEGNYFLEINDTDDVNCGFYDSGAGGYRDHDATNATISIGNWYHIACVFDNTNNLFKIYVNGIETYSASETAASPDANDDQFRMGQEGTSAQEFIGYLDDVKLFNYARTPAQVAWEYSNGKPMAWWKMDESSWSGVAGEVKDSSGNSFTGVRSGNATTGTGKYNNAGVFDGSGDFVTISTSPFFVLKGDLSATFWINRNIGTSSGGQILVIENGAGETEADNAMIYLELSNESVSNATLEYIHENGNGSNQVSTFTSAVTANEWIHYAITRNVTTNTISLYKNGVLFDTDTYTTDPTTTSTTLPVLIGQRSNATLSLDADLDDVRIYNYTLSAQQVKTVMNEGAATRFGP